MVRTSTGKIYKVKYDRDRGQISSTDQGSRYKGYLNYPMIAFLMKIGMLPGDDVVIPWFARQNYDALTRLYDRDYEVIERRILTAAGHDDEVSKMRLDKYIASLTSAIQELKLGRMPHSDAASDEDI